MPNLRKTIVINKKFQHHYATMLVAMTVLFCNIFLIVNMILPGEQRLYLSSFMAAVIGVTELTLVAGVWYFSLRATHRIAGPIFVFSRQLRAYAAGDLTQRISLRKTDMFAEEAGEINAGLGQLHNSVEQVKALAADVQAAYDRGGDIGPPLQALDASLKALHTSEREEQ